MAENPRPSPATPREEAQMAINTLSLAMANDPKVSAEEIRSSKKRLEELGMDPEVVWVMLAEESANDIVLAEISGLPRSQIRKTLESLTEQGLVTPAEGPHKPPSLNLGIPSGFGKTVEVIGQRAKKLRDEGRIRKIVRAVPKTVDELLAEYPLYSSLSKRFQEGGKDLKSQKNILVGLSALRSNMEEELDMAIQNAKEEDKEHMRALKNGLIEKMGEKQGEVSRAIRKSLEKSPNDLGKNWENEISGLSPENLEELSFELHGLLSRLQNNPQEEIKGLLTPIEEYRIIKISETQAKLAKVEAELANPTPKASAPIAHPITPEPNMEEPKHEPIPATLERPTEEEKRAAPKTIHPPVETGVAEPIEKVEDSELPEEMEPEVEEEELVEPVFKPNPSRNLEDMTDLFDYFDAMEKFEKAKAVPAERQAPQTSATTLATPAAAAGVAGNVREKLTQPFRKLFKKKTGPVSVPTAPPETQVPPESAPAEEPQTQEAPVNAPATTPPTPLQNPASAPTASPVTPPPLPRPKREDFESDEEYLRAQMEFGESATPASAPTGMPLPSPEPKREDFESDEEYLRAQMESGESKEIKKLEQTKIAKSTRRNVLKALIGLAVASALPAGMVASESKFFGSGLSKPDLNINWNSQKSELYNIPKQYFHPEAKKALEELQADGRASKEPMPETQQYYNPERELDFIKGPIIIRTINGHEVKGKKECVDRFEAAWKILAEYKLPFHGNNSDFRTNVDQFDICARKKAAGDNGACSNLTGGLHTQGQAFDVGTYFTLTTVEPGGTEVRDVLKMFGFTWGDSGAEKMGPVRRTKWAVNIVYTFGKNIVSEKDIKKAALDAKESAERNDKVHFQMTKSNLENMIKAGDIETAEKKAREYLEGLRKK